MSDEEKALGDAEFKKGNFQVAIDHYTKAIATNAASGTIGKHVLLSNRSAAWCSLNKYDNALKDAKACTQADPSFAKGWSRKAAAMYGLGDMAGAAQAYKKCLEKDPNSPCKADLARIEAAMAGGKPAGACPAGFGGAPQGSARPAAQAYASAPSPGSSTPAIKGQKLMQAAVLIGQIVAVGCALAFVVTRDPHQARHIFGRAILAALVSFAVQAVATHGLPNVGTFKTMYSALRGKADQSQLQGISRVAMDLNTHNIFYCSLLISSLPSILLLVPVVLHCVLSIGHRATALADLVPAVKGIVVPLAQRITSRQHDVLRMCAQLEVGIFLVLIFELVTPRRNIMLIILYGQLLRVRYLVNAENKEAWAALSQRTDGLFLHARCPAAVQGVYRQIKTRVANLGIPQQPSS